MSRDTGRPAPWDGSYPALYLARASLFALGDGDLEARLRWRSRFGLGLDRNDVLANLCILRRLDANIEAGVQVPFAGFHRVGRRSEDDPLVIRTKSDLDVLLEVLASVHGDLDLFLLILFQTRGCR